MEIAEYSQKYAQARSNVSYECSANSVLFSVEKYCFATLCSIVMKRERESEFSEIFHFIYKYQRKKKHYGWVIKFRVPPILFTAPLDICWIPKNNSECLCHVRQNWNEASNCEFYAVITCTLRLNHWKNILPNGFDFTWFAIRINVFIGMHCKVWLNTFQHWDNKLGEPLLPSSLPSSLLISFFGSCSSLGTIWRRRFRSTRYMFLRWFYCFIFVCEQNNTEFMLCFNTTAEDRLIAAQQ